MIRKALYLGLAVASAWQLFAVVHRKLQAPAKSCEQKEAVSVWENAGGNPAPALRPGERRG